MVKIDLEDWNKVPKLTINIDWLLNIVMCTIIYYTLDKYPKEIKIEDGEVGFLGDVNGKLITPVIRLFCKGEKDGS